MFSPFFEPTLFEYCKWGNKRKVLEILKTNTDIGELNNGLAGACQGGQKKIIELMIEHGANDWTRGMTSACFLGNKEIINLMLEKGNKLYDVNCVLLSACYYGQLDVAKIMVKQGGNNFDGGLANCCARKDKDLVLYMLVCGADIKNCYMSLDFDDVYYLLHKNVKMGDLYSELVDKCQKWKLEFENVANELFIKDVASVVSEY